MITSFPDPVVTLPTDASAVRTLSPSPRSKEEPEPSKTLTVSLPEPAEILLFIEETSMVLSPDPASMVSVPAVLVIAVSYTHLTLPTKRIV